MMEAMVTTIPPTTIVTITLHTSPGFIMRHTLHQLFGHTPKLRALHRRPHGHHYLTLGSLGACCSPLAHTTKHNLHHRILHIQRPRCRSKSLHILSHLDQKHIYPPEQEWLILADSSHYHTTHNNDRLTIYDCSLSQHDQTVFFRPCPRRQPHPP